MYMQLPAYHVTFEITPNQQATITAIGDEVKHIVSALLRSHFNSIEITPAAKPDQRMSIFEGTT